MSGIAGTVFMFAIAYVLVRTKFRANPALDFVSWLPWAIPGVLFSLGGWTQESRTCIYDPGSDRVKNR